MKFSRTVALALGLATGLTGAVSAQTVNATTMNHPQPATSPGLPAASCDAVRINAGGESLAAEAQRYTDQVMAAQERLHAAGLYSGPADGIMEADTRAALARFQEQNGLQRTQGIDRSTWALLMGGAPTSTGSSQPSSEPAPAGAGGNTAPRR